MNTVAIPKRVAELAIQALIYQARSEAGHSQAPDLIKAEDTEQFKAAQQIADCVTRTDLSTSRGLVAALENFLVVREEVHRLAEKAELNQASESYRRYAHAQEVLVRARLELVQAVSVLSGVGN